MSYLHATPPGQSPSEHARELDANRPLDAHEARPLRVLPVITAKRTWESHGCSAPGCGYPDGKPCIHCGLIIAAISS